MGVLDSRGDRLEPVAVGSQLCGPSSQALMQHPHTGPYCPSTCQALAAPLHARAHTCFEGQAPNRLTVIAKRPGRHPRTRSVCVWLQSPSGKDPKLAREISETEENAREKT